MNETRVAGMRKFRLVGKFSVLCTSIDLPIAGSVYAVFDLAQPQDTVAHDGGIVLDSKQKVERDVWSIP